MGLISSGTTIFDAGAMASGFGGSLVFIKKLTASSSGTLSFVDGASSVVLDNTYKEYLFTFKNIHPATDAAEFQFQGNAAGGSGYNETITSTLFQSIHSEDGTSESGLAYVSANDQAQGTSFQDIYLNSGNGNDECIAGTLHLFNPSSTTFVKHFISRMQGYHNANSSFEYYCAGYFNTTSAIDEIQFKYSSGNIDAGDICLYGIS
tara:strand:- start:45 stop:662 length:618 start_codon:yes stop_codon:yes gene_type:complete